MHFRTDRPHVQPRQMLDAGNSGVRRVGMLFLVLFLFVAFSRITDILLPHLYLALITSLFALVATVASGGLKRALDSRAGWLLIGLTIWLVVCVPFSFWRGGSVNLLRDQWSRSFLAFVIAGGLPVTLRDCRWSMYSIGLASVTVALMSLLWGTMSIDGRLAAEGTLGNPNDLAQLLLLGLPFLMLLTVGRTYVVPKRVVGGGCAIGVLYVTVQTGSRMGMVGIAALILAIIASSSWVTRIKFAVALAVAVAIVFPSISPEQRLRYLTTFEAADSEKEMTASERGAIGSKEQRRQELLRSIRLTFENPIVGVGPGNFSPVAAEESKEKGERAPWVETHNSFTQMSSEAGIPGFLLYLGAFWTSLSISHSTYKRYRGRNEFHELGDAAYYMWLCLVTFAVTALFSNMAYQIYLPTLAGLCVALDRCAKVAATVDAPAVVSQRVKHEWQLRVHPQRPV